MPKTINAEPVWNDTLEGPRDGEGVDAADVNLPFEDLLGNDKFLRQALIDLSNEVRSLKAGQSGFTVTAPATLTAEPARSYPVAVGIVRYGGFAGSVDLGAQNLPAGVEATFNPDPTTGNASTMTLTASAGAVPGRYDVLVTGTSGGVTSSAKVLLTVTSASLTPRFDMTIGTSAVVDRSSGKTAALPMRITRQGGFSDPVQLSVVSPPAGITATFSANPVTGGLSDEPNASTLTLTVEDTVPAGTYSINVRAVSGAIVVTRSVALTITALAQAGAPNFWFSAFELDRTDGSLMGGATLRITRGGGFTGPVVVEIGSPLSYGPTVLIDGKPWKATILGDTARITLDWSGRGYDGGENAGRVIGMAGIVPITSTDGYSKNYYYSLTGTGYQDGVALQAMTGGILMPLQRGVNFQVRWTAG